MAEELRSKLKVKVPTYIVRNEDIQLTNGEFLLYTRFSFLYFRNYQQEEMHIDYKKLMLQIGITDTRTLKKYLNKLYKTKLIKNNIENLLRKGEITIIFNSDMYNKKNQHFTMMNADIFNFEIDENAFRLVWYYKSHINTNDTTRDRSYCFVSIDTLKSNLKMGSDTINNANKTLEKNKLVKITRHKIEENDELIHDRYNNHYHVNNKLF